MSCDYKIVEVLFSSHTEVIGSEDNSFSRKTSLVAHVSYQYKGIDSNDEFGVALLDLTDLCEVTADENGNYTSINCDDVSGITYDTIKSKADPIIVKQIGSAIISAKERNCIETSLSQLRSLKDLPSKGTM